MSDSISKIFDEISKYSLCYSFIVACLMEEFIIVNVRIIVGCNSNSNYFPQTLFGKRLRLAKFN